MYQGNAARSISAGWRLERRMSAAAHSQVIPSVAKITSELTHLGKHVSLSGAIPSDVAGQAAYTLRVSPPRNSGGLLGDLQLAWDAYRGVPLRFAVYARGNSSPVLQLKATDISYGRVSPGVFNISPPPGAKVVRISIPSGAKKGPRRSSRAPEPRWTAYAPLAAPASDAGLVRRSTSQVGHKPGPCLASADERHGRARRRDGLGSVAVLEEPTHGSSKSPAQSNGPTDRATQPAHREGQRHDR